MPSLGDMAAAFILMAEHERERERANRARSSGRLLAAECAARAQGAERQAELLVGLAEADHAKGSHQVSAST